MRAVVQRTGKVRLSVDGEIVSEIEKGLAVYFGVKRGDDRNKADFLVRKIAALRVFEDENGKMNLSVKDVGGEIMFISQFTLLADVSHGNRPGFSDAEDPAVAKEIYLYAAEKLRGEGVPVKLGVFGADMKIEQFNDGPVTIIYDV